MGFSVAMIQFNERDIFFIKMAKIVHEVIKSHVGILTPENRSPIHRFQIIFKTTYIVDGVFTKIIGGSRIGRRDKWKRS